jgi:serine/threonine protein kinase
VDYYTDLINRLYCNANARYGRYVLLGDPEVVVPDVLVRAELYRAGDESDRGELSLFCNVSGFAGVLWEHSVRSLLRLRAINHPALPEVKRGGFDPDYRIAFTITHEEGRALPVDDAIAWAARNQFRALEQFSMLLDALSNLHSARIMHRNVTAGSVRAQQRSGDDPDDRAMKLTRFEMSALIGNLMRRTEAHDDGRAKAVTSLLYLTPPKGIDESRHHVYLPPERHSFLFDENAGVRREWNTTDLFGLGVLGWEWFCGSVPQVLPDAYAAVESQTGRQRAVALARLHDEMRAHLTGTRLPDALAHTLRHMLHPQPRERFSAFEASRYLENNWAAIRAAWEEETVRKPHLLAFMPAESVETIYLQRGWIAHSPAEPAGRDDLKAFFENELRSADLVHSPSGALGYASGPEERLKEAEWVLIGRKAVWFCAFYYPQEYGGDVAERFDDTLVVKFIRDREFAQELVTAHPRRRIGRMDLIPWKPGQDIDSFRKDRPSWKVLTDAVRASVQRDPKNEEFLQSLYFLVEYQRADLNSHTYPFVRMGAADGKGRVIVQLDSARDRNWRHRSPLLTAYCADVQRRPPLGDFFDRVARDAEEETVRLEVVGGRKGVPFFGRESFEVEFKAKKDPDSIQVAVPRGRRMPEAGWIRPAEDSGSSPQLARQERALNTLRTQSGLVESLRKPYSFDIGRGRWSEDGDGSEKLEGNAEKTISDMLAIQPFYALQGPPGSGKTTVAVRAVRAFLRTEEGSRVLVSAQSNFALDHLAKRLIELLPPHMLVLREAPEGREEDVVKDREVVKHTLAMLTPEVARVSRTLIEAKLRGGGDGFTAAERTLAEQWGFNPDGEVLEPAERKLAELWLDRVQSDEVELADRIRNGASVVLATCSIAATVNDTVRDPADTFDWVILEEAAKAWPTEVIIPLVLGARWTLIGDHRQLGPHREGELRTFLDSLKNHPDEKLRLHYERKGARLEALSFFGSLFEGRQDEAQSGGTSPLGELSHQFRMHPDIAEPVSRVFYPKVPAELDEDGLPVAFLKSGTRTRVPHGVRIPACLAGAALVWIDTTGCEGYEDAPRWFNQGEADLVANLVDKMDPPAAASEHLDKPDSLVVLTPYRAQVRLLGAKGVLLNRIHTVHSFQGQEADRVIVSLVRRNQRGTRPAQNIGHVGQSNVINVLLSRARRLMVVVGSLEHYGSYGGPDWRMVTDTVRRYGRRVRADEWEQW